MAQVDGRVLRAALLCAAAGCGAKQVPGRAELVVTRGRVSGVQVDGQTLTADTVMLAAGAWSALLCAPLGVDLPVAPQRGLTVHLHLPGDENTNRWPAVRGPDNAYLVAFGGGRVVAGASIEANSGYNSSVSSKALHQVLDAALTLAPGLREAIVTDTAVGLRPISHDGLPLLGAVSNLDGMIVATGLGGQGLTYGPYLGASAARLAQGRDVALPLGGIPARPSAGRRGAVSRTSSGTVTAVDLRLLPRSSSG